LTYSAFGLLDNILQEKNIVKYNSDEDCRQSHAHEQLLNNFLKIDTLISDCPWSSSLPKCGSRIKL